MLGSKQEIKKVYYTFENLSDDIKGIIDEIEYRQKVPEIVIGLARGGLVPAVMLSHHFNVPMIPLSLSLRDFKTNTVDLEKVLEKTIGSKNLLNKKILIVDDIFDTGETLDLLYNSLNNIFASPLDNIQYAVLYYNTSHKAKSLTKPDYSVRLIDKNKDNIWLVFPWEEF